MIADEAALRAFIARILGWSDPATIDHALRSIDLAAAHRAALVVLGETEMAPIAHALHRRTLGDDRPFVVCDRRRIEVAGSARRPGNRGVAVEAVRAARGGSLCVHYSRMPTDARALVARVRDPASLVQLIVCGQAFRAVDPFLILPVPIRVPPLSARADELPRIVNEYALEAIKMFGAGRLDFTPADRTWVIQNAARTLSEIEHATQRVVALNISSTFSEASRRVGLSHVALGKWLKRRARRRRPGR